MNEHELQQQFDRHYIREPRAQLLLGRRIVVAGAGAMGSFVTAHAARSGADVLTVDNDHLLPENALRHEVREARWLYRRKATALAEKLRSELPQLQWIQDLVADLEALTLDDYREMLRGASLVIGCTGRDRIDRVLDRVARELRIPFIAPSLWAGQQPILGDLFIGAWNIPNRGACFSCLRPPRLAAPPPAEAQPGFEAEIQRIASLTAEVGLALLLPDSPPHAALVEQLRRGANYMLFPRWPPAPHTVVIRPRSNCAVCRPQRGRRSTAPTITIPARDWIMGGTLAVIAVLHQFVPGFDHVAAFVFIPLAVLWWRGLLPSFAAVAIAVRRFFEGGA